MCVKASSAFEEPTISVNASFVMAAQVMSEVRARSKTGDLLCVCDWRLTK